METKKQIQLGKDDVEVIDGKVVIKNADMLQAIQSEQEVNINGNDNGQNAFSIGVIVTF